MNQHVALPPKVRLLVPVLGSPSDGEALGACRAIGRTLRGVGLDFHDMAQAIGTTTKSESAPRSAGPPPEYRPRRRHVWSFTEKQTAEHKRMARHCRDRDNGRLSTRERNFVWAIANHHRELTISQADWLVSICDRLEQEDRRTWA